MAFDQTRMKDRKQEEGVVGKSPPLPHQDHNKTKITRDFKSEGRAGWDEPDQVGIGGHNYTLHYNPTTRTGAVVGGGGQRLDELAGRLQLQS